MIPYTLLQGKIDGIDVRIVDCSIFHFEFRVPEKMEEIKNIVVSFYNGKKYDSIPIHQFTYEQVEKDAFSYTYRIETEQEDYVNSMRKLQERIQTYTTLKIKDEQEKSIDYPFDLDEIYPTSKSDLLRSMFQILCPDTRYKELLKSIRLGICLENLILVSQFLELEWNAFRDYYYQQVYLHKHPIKDVEVEYIYIGNQFCEHLVPSKEILIRVLNKCKVLHLKSVLVLPPMKEHSIPVYKEIVELFEEIVVNDLGMLELLKDSSKSIICGILLNKHVKDSRMGYMNLDMNSFRDVRYFLKYRGSCESCGYNMNSLKGSDYYFPKYQTNTASMCTMYAKCHNGNRAFQQEVLDCPKYCLSQHFLYPSHIKTIGEYNSLFGYDVKILQDSAYLEEILNAGIERMIVSV